MIRKSLIPLMLAVVSPPFINQANAYDFEKDGVYYDRLDSERCVVSGYDVYSDITELTVPETIEHYCYDTYSTEILRVVGVNDNAFASDQYNPSRLTKVVLPHNVTKIPDGAFKGCAELESVLIKYEYSGYRQYISPAEGYRYIPEPDSIGITEIGAHAFDGCVKLESLPLEEITSTNGYQDFDNEVPQRALVKIGEYAFYKCAALTQASRSGFSYVELGAYAFAECESLTKVDFPCHVIPDHAFYKCKNLTSFPGANDRITGIGDYAFYECPLWDFSLKRCSNLKKIGAYAFANVTPGPNYYGGDDYRDLVIPESVTDIGNGAFANIYQNDTEYYGIRTVTFRNPMAEIPDSLFHRRNNLVKVTFSSDVTSVSGNAFQQTGISDFDFSKLTSIGADAFAYTRLVQVVLPDCLTSLGNSAFRGCESLTDINIPEGISSIKGTFSGCKSLVNVSLPSSLTTIGSCTFMGSGIMTLHIPASVTSIGSEAFMESDIMTLHIPSSVTSIGSEAFRSCKNLETITIPEGVKKIETYLFYKSAKLKSIVLPSTLTTVNKYAMEGCSKLEEITVKATTPPTVQDGTAFTYVDKNTCVVYVPQGCTDAYKAKAYWKQFKNILDKRTGILNDEDWSIVCDLKEELTGLGWECPWDVSESSDKVTSMEELTVADGRIVGVDLSGKGLTGEFPWGTLRFPFLRTLNLTNNALTGDISTGLAARLNESSVKTDSLQTLMIGANRFSGNLAPFVNSFPKLITLNASRNCFSDIYPAIGHDMKSFIYSKQSIDRTITIDLVDFNAEALLSEFPTLPLYYNGSWKSSFNLNCWVTKPYADDPDNYFGCRIELRNGKLKFLCSSVNTDYRGQSGDVLNAATLDSDGDNNHTLGIKLLFSQGDVNFTGTVDIGDVQGLVTKIQGRYGDNPFNFTAADLYADGKITVQDIVKAVDILLADIDPAKSSARIRPQEEDDSEPEATVYRNANSLRIQSDSEVAAFDILVADADSFEPSKELEHKGFAYTARKSEAGMRIIGYALNGAVLNGDTPVGTVFGVNALVSHADIAAPDSRLLTTTLNNVATDVGGVDCNDNLKVEVRQGGIKVTDIGGAQMLAWTVAAADGRVIAHGTMDLSAGGAGWIPIDFNGIAILSIRGGQINITKKINLRK